MPRGKRNPLLDKSNPQPVADPAPVRPQIQQMSGHASAEEMAAELPTNTMVETEEAAPRRKRRTKAEMAAVRGEVVTDPNLSDPKYVKALQRFNAFGAPRIIKGAFSMTGKALDDERIALNPDDSEAIDDYFYLVSKKFQPLDPTGHWFSMILCFLGLLASLVADRIILYKGEEIQKNVSKWFGKGGKEEEGKEGE